MELSSSSCAEIAVSIDLRRVSQGTSAVSQRKSCHLSCMRGKRELLCTQCRGIGPHLAARGKFPGFSRVAAGTWGIFSSYGRDGHLELEFVQ